MAWFLFEAFKTPGPFMKRFYFILLIATCLSSRAYAQNDNPGVVPFIVDEGDTIPVVNLPVVDILSAFGPDDEEAFKKYLKLRRDVLRAYPYAKLAANQLKIINDSLAKIPSERAQKKYIKATEKQMKEKFEKDLRKLTYTQGRILIKLVDRETGNTSYALVKDLRGGLQAFFWQSLARFFGANLKSEYDPEGEDRMIEGIVRAIERGEIKVVNK
jgi:Domain of unknown function (DUF4294)